MDRRLRPLGAPIVAVGLAASLGLLPAGAVAAPEHAPRAEVAEALRAPADAGVPPQARGDGIAADVTEVAVDQTLDEVPGDSVVPEPIEQADASEAPGDVYSALGSPSGLAVAGVTWADDTAPAGTTVTLRTRTADAWTDWVELETEDVVSGPGESGPDDGTKTGAEVRDGTSPAFVGAVDEVQVAIAGPDGVLPEDVRLVLVDPGEGDQARADAASRAGDRASLTSAEVRAAPSSDVRSDVDAETETGAVPDTVRPEDSVASADLVAAGLATAAVARPAIHSRAQWGADESIMTWTPVLARVNGAVIHHTAGTNSYTQAQVPSIIRGIYTYHAISRGWGDIGYNFLVDKFGGVWEGRRGGIDKAIIGGHAVGVNDETVGISVMGEYGAATVPPAAMDAIVRLVAWKLSLHGVRANSTVSIDGVSRPAVIGHRDVASTACPGANLYPRLGEIRTRAAALQGSGPFRTLNRNLLRDARPELVVRNGTAVSLLTGGRGLGVVVGQGTGYQGGLLVPAGDQNRDGVDDLFWRDPRGNLFLSTRTGGTLATKVQVGNGWNVMDAIVGGYDWDGDKFPDLLGRRASNGTLWLYPGAPGGKFRHPRQVGNGWQTMSKLTLVPLSNGRSAILAHDRGGRLSAYPGNGRGGFLAPIRMGTGWSAMNALVAAGDMTGDGRPDVMARDGANVLWVYAGRGDGTLGARTRIGGGWGSQAIAAGRHGTTTEIYRITTAGAVSRIDWYGASSLTTLQPTGVTVPSTARVLYAGDWDGDGRPDLMSLRADGNLFLHPRTGSGMFTAAGRKIGNGWDVMTDVVAAPNFAGDGKPALVALERSNGRIWLYPGNGTGGFGTRVQIGTAAKADMLILPGAWTGRVPDVITRENGNLFLREGDGYGLLRAPRQIGNGWNIATRVTGVGDANGDGHADIYLTKSDGTVWIYPGNGSGGFRAASQAGRVPAGVATS
jgi:hypothetical protein